MRCKKSLTRKLSHHQRCRAKNGCPDKNKVTINLLAIFDYLYADVPPFLQKQREIGAHPWFRHEAKQHAKDRRRQYARELSEERIRLTCKVINKARCTKLWSVINPYSSWEKTSGEMKACFVLQKDCLPQIWRQACSGYTTCRIRYRWHVNRHGVYGLRPVCEIQFAGFDYFAYITTGLCCALSQSQLAAD